MKIFLLFIAAAIATACFVQWFGRYVCDYNLSDDSIDVLLFNTIPIVRIRYSDIDDIGPVPYRKTLWPSLRTVRLGNRIVGDVVAIRRRSGIAREFLVTPDDAQDFVQRAKARLAK